MKKLFKKEKNNNELQRIQKILLNEMERLDNQEIMAERGNKEIKVSGALSKSATSYIKAVQTQIKVFDLSNKYNTKVSELNEFFGINKSEK